jgi:signal transduction histidine kinase
MPTPTHPPGNLGRFDWTLPALAPRYRAAALAGFGVVYAALDIIGYELRIQHGSLVILWPAAGLLLAALFLTSVRVWTWLLGLQWLIGIGVDYLLAERFHPFWSTMFAAADSLDGVVGASVATFLIRQPAQPRIRQVLGFFAAAGLGAAASALLGALCAVNVLGDANYLHQWQIWWAGNWLGSLAIAPVALTWAVRWRLPELSVRTAHRWDLIAISIVLMGMTQWIFSAAPGSLTTFLQLPSMLLAILVVAAFRLPPRWSTTLAATAVLLASYHSSQGLGPFAAQPDLFARIGSLQFFFAALLVFTFMLATVLLEKQRTFEQLTTSEDRYRQFVTHSSEAVWRVELDEPMPLGLPMDAQLPWLKRHAHIAECNVSYQRLHADAVDSPPDFRQWRADVPWSAIYLDHLEAAARQGYSMDGLRFTLATPEGQRVYLANFSAVVEDSRLLRVWGVARNITELADLNERLRIGQERLRAYAGHLIGAEERTRRTMALSLHEGVERQLAEVNTRLDAIASSSPAGLRQVLDGLRGTLRRVQEHTRRLIGDVSPPGLYDIGLGAALQWLAIYMRTRDALNVTLSIRLNEQVLSLDKRVLIFQVVRELLRNVARHARVDSAQVHLTHSAHELTVQVIDDGVGFDWQYDLFADSSRGFGFFTVADRVRSANGRFTVDTAPGRGCRVTVHFPLAAELDEQLPRREFERRA